MSIIDQKNNYDIYRKYLQLKNDINVLKSSFQLCIGDINDIQSNANYNSDATAAQKTFLTNALTWLNNNLPQIPSFPN